ncbi:phosphotransferase system enzyme I (PtsI) [Aequitasia blattaphilus]|uniref:Phosphoenolpyruvate-protein phosphotransferase n=1 Tax=Aequitasia blattaphilus TaxID=2949332 RepID=A0ABT1E7P0_9FIRM|nr:phosphoenolpyruvate--protein phosphotransferase [Aequitasia blattaphilus]MCP1101836.1 phosphoenolpyruvate--protein phosphotransferase [Aequitasia blattaphilus]MCR8614476.1 phosphoenolpyruvate--protein phosphotransferase [Aequitasia blattaphilus]
MEQFTGKGVFPGIAIGKIKLYRKNEQTVKRTKIENVEKEIQRYLAAVDHAVSQLQELYQKALGEVGEANAAIFEVHQMMLQDGDYSESVENIIKTQMVNASFAVATTGDNFAKMFSSMEDAYMKERAADVQDITERLLNNLSGHELEKNESTEPVIILANDLSPSETVQLDKEMVLSFVTSAGSSNSHTAILAKTMAIPSLVGTKLPLKDEFDGALAIVDGNTGTIYIDPDQAILDEFQKKKEQELLDKNLLLKLKNKEAITLDGKKVMLYANIGNVKDLGFVLESGAAGIGLFRSEFIFLERTDYPTEEEQFEIYKTVAETMAEKPVIIRTMDIGADKQCDYFNLEPEENPALGYRAIRICLTRPELFKTQLRALFRASVYGNIQVMYPMIANLFEVQKIKELVAEVETELTEAGIQYRLPKQGLMIETPAAALISDTLAKEVDFFSIGTNDLSQYTLAIDRQNPHLDTFYDSHHPGLLSLIKLVVKNAHSAGIWVGICGELGADPSLTQEFLAMGIDELSVSPGNVLPIKKVICESNITEYEREIYAN